MLRSHERIASFAVAFGVLMALHQLIGVNTFIHDSGAYWSYSAPTVLLNYPDIIRGYFYPALLMPLNVVSENFPATGKLPFRLASSLVYAWVLTSPTFDYFAKCFGSAGSMTFLRRLLFALLPVALFPGLFVYPLSDMPGALMMVGATLLAWRATGRFWWLFAMLAGVAAGAAYNTRTVYLFGVIALLLICPIIQLRGQPPVRRVAAPVLLVLGALLVAVPQMIINKHVHGKASPFVYATVGGKPLMAVQLYLGVRVQRYETTVRKDEATASRYYADPAGISFRQQAMGGDLGEPSIGGYVRMFLRDPLLFAGIYARHFIIGVDVRDGFVYTSALSAERNVLSLFSFTLLFFAGLVAASRGGIAWRELALISPLLFAVMAVAPGMVETRFFLPLYLIAFGMIFTQVNGPSLLPLVKRRAVAIGLSYVILGAIFLAITTAGLASLQHELP